MLHKLRPRSVYDVCAALALFVALGGTAYAVNTIGSTDIIDGQVKSVDIGNDEIQSGDVKDGTINTFDVHSFLGVDVVDNTLTTDDIENSSLTSLDIAPNGIVGSDILNDTVSDLDILNGGLNDEDLGQTVLVDFVGTIGVVPAAACVYRDVITTPAIGGDHLVLTPNTSDAAAGLIYTAEYAPTGANGMKIKACNPTAANIDDANTHFNLLAIDAQ